MAFELGAVVGAAALEWVAQQLLIKGKAKLGPETDLAKAIGEALDQADKAEPELFASCHRDGMQGLDGFLKGFLENSVVLQELQKPVTGKGAPDAEVLEAVFRQELEALEGPQRVTKENLLPGLRFNEAGALRLERLTPWMKAFAENYFQRMPDGVRFWVARADYCEQLRNAFDDVKFGGIAVEGQGIDRAEKLADIFVMPDMRVSKKEIGHSLQTFEEYIYHLPKGGKLPSLLQSLQTQELSRIQIITIERALEKRLGITRQDKILVEQKQAAKRYQEQDIGRVISAKEVFLQSHRAVLLGAPGSGKTTLMSYWAVTTCTTEDGVINPDLPDDCLPILIRIRDLAKHPEMGVLEFAIDFAQRELSAKELPKGFFEYWLDNGQALILLDGLDEVADEAQRRKTVERISNFLGQYKENPAIITSRPSGYKRDFFRTDEYPHYELQPFDDSKIDEFIDHWYDSRFELVSERQRRKDGLRKALKAQSRIKRLARNPLLLTIIALIHRYQAQLPHERYKLYDKAVETLLTSWDANKELSNHETLEYLQLDDLRRLMERLAYWIHSQGGTGDEEGGTLIDREELIVQLSKYIKEMKGVERYQAKEEAKRFLELVVRDRAGLLAQQGQDRYAFVHKTFQEYLTAMEIRDQQEEGFEVVLEHVEEHLHDPHWEEVLLLLIAQQKRSNPSKVLETILSHDTPYEQWLHRNLFFAGMCLAENVPITKSGLAQGIIQQLVEFEVRDHAQISLKLKQKAFQVLSGLCETQVATEAINQLSISPNIDEWRFLCYQRELQPEQAAIKLLALLNDNNPEVRDRAAEHLGLLGNTSKVVIDGLLALLRDEDSYVRCRAAESLGRLGNSSQAVINGLLLLLQGDDTDMYYHAAKSLVQLGNASQVVVSELIELLNSNIWASSHSAEALVQLGYTSNPITDILLALLEADDLYVRGRASESLIQVGCQPNENEAVINGLIELLKNDSSELRECASESIIRLGRIYKKIPERLLSFFIEKNFEVRFQSARVLGQIGKTSQPVISGLLTLIGDESPKVRACAAESLGQISNTSPAVIDGLLTLLEDESGWVRSHAAESLVQLGYTSSDVVDTLLTLLEKDNPYTRANAVKSLGQLGNVSQSVIDALLAILQDSNPYVRDRAAESLGRLGNASQPVLDALVKLFQDENPFVRSRSAESLVQLGNNSDALIHGLLTLLKDNNPYVRDRATQCLAQVEDAAEPMLEGLLDLLQENDSYVCDHAATSLTQLGQKSSKVLPVLVQWIEQNENQPYVGNGIDILSELVT